MSQGLCDALVAVIDALQSDAAARASAAEALHDTVLVEAGKEAIDLDMGAIVANSRVALWVLRLSGYAPVAGEVRKPTHRVYTAWTSPTTGNPPPANPTLLGRRCL